MGDRLATPLEPGEPGTQDTADGTKWAPVDVGDLAKYAFATTSQFAFVALVLKSLDKLLVGRLPVAAAFPLFASLSLRSRVFSCLDNRRPDRVAQGGAATPEDTKRPSWTPPGIAFPIIWSTITLLRSVSASLVYASLGNRLCTQPLLALVAHLCVGDTWNSITNFERRLGVSFAAVFAVLLSVYYAVVQFWLTMPMAGIILAPSACWITVATVLTGAIWRMNKPLQPLWPVKGDGKSGPMRLPLTL